MKRNLVYRFTAACVIGVLFGLYVHHEYVRWAQRGKEAFIVYQAHRFDRFMVSPQPVIATIFVFTLAAVLVFGMNELLAAGLSRMFRDPRLSENNG